MAALIFARKAFVLLLACTAMATALDHDVSVQNPSGVQRFLHHLAKRDASEDSEQSQSAPMGALMETGKLLRTVAMLPAETLQVLRMVTVPLIDTTLSLPANILEGAASMSPGKLFQSQRQAQGHARSASSDFWKYLKPWKLFPKHHVLLSKDIALGPLSFKKVLEIGAHKVAATTPAPEAILLETTPVPVAMPAPAAPEGTPAPIPVVATTAAPPPPADILTTTPAPPAVAPAPPSPVVVVVPQRPNESTNQIAVVQNSRAGPVATAAGISEN